MKKYLILTNWICIAAVLFLPMIAHANAKWKIMQGTGDYASKGYKAVAQPAMQKGMKKH